ncbi:hypothetical protein Goklo_020319 [Gossypium klotzschianum]|uniref:DUF659 domain-containing protein n=1 Tax=Gossypium klotzschianum TaxID=34286 RepID=A0A7J8URH6_9ROSI|nr:hypothetical protein [Gossypium klotzschianum]
MPRSRNKEDAAPSDYYGWRCGEPVEAKEERIRLGNRGDYGDSGDNDELTIARHESMGSQVEWEERQCRRAITDQDSVFEIRGGSNFGTQEIRRLFSVYNSEISGRERQWTNLDSPKARLANMDHVLEISKIATEVGKLVRGPSTYEVTGVYLEDEYKEIQEWVNSFRPIWEERGVTIMCDGWKGTTNQYIINFLIYSTRGIVFKKFIDASSVTSCIAEYYFGLMEKMVDEIGEEFVVLVVTDNKAAINAGGHMLMQKRRHLYWSACSAHCLNLILEEIGNRKSVKKIQESLVKVLKMSDDNEKPTMSFIYEAMDRAKLLLLYRDKMDSFGTPLVQAAILRTNPAEWWINYGGCAPQLQCIAVRVLSQNNFIFKVHMKRKSVKELEMGFNPINIDNIFEEDDPLNAWIEEREDSTLDSEPNFSWLLEELFNETNEENMDKKLKATIWMTFHLLNLMRKMFNYRHLWW